MHPILIIRWIRKSTNNECKILRWHNQGYRIFFSLCLSMCRTLIVTMKEAILKTLQWHLMKPFFLQNWIIAQSDASFSQCHLKFYWQIRTKSCWRSIIPLSIWLRCSIYANFIVKLFFVPIYHLIRFERIRYDRNIQAQDIFTLFLKCSI